MVALLEPAQVHVSGNKGDVSVLMSVMMCCAEPCMQYMRSGSVTQTSSICQRMVSTQLLVLAQRGELISWYGVWSGIA